MPRGLSRQDPGEVRIGSDSASIRRPHAQQWIEARILHRQDHPDGSPSWVVLDRLVHRAGEDRLGTADVRGAVTTELRW